MADEPSGEVVERPRCQSCCRELEEQEPQKDQDIVMDKLVVLVLKKPYPLLSIGGKLYLPNLR